MTNKEMFMMLSSSKYMGQSTCKFINGDTLKIRNEMLAYLKALTERDVASLIEESKSKGIFIGENLVENIYMPPKYLWCKGNTSLKMTRVSVIGARYCSQYGKDTAYAIGKSLAESNIQVVSGLAYGVDIKAHEGALSAGGSTIAVLGSGILNCYPKEHRSYLDQMCQKGLILSEYGLHGKPLKHHFPFRNRLISGLSQIIIVVEAKKKSGTMITVNYALDQGKTIMAVPGRIDSKLSEGTNLLIDSGAKVFTKIDDVLEEIINI